ncbi:DUF6263 family protein [Nonlabens agnitus]|uniref:Lipocalin-like domain-containing protein n=1 Tax=Nonlabens agnitus TaxID=870484 RepID=A0A2S9WXE5_9FLAO|nr:DUF6263 family protein [Nonlabens agnitus]PRP68150.1 hypothetical protein BST86_14150 [Nonlabens agnitus]
MKNLLVLFALAISVQVFAQESALLRVNYSEGDVYEIKMIQQQSTGIQGSTDMTIMMDMEVTEVTDEVIEAESKITSIVMDVNQAGMSMSYDSSKNDDELDATGKMLKGQLSPMMSAVIRTTMDEYGNTLSTKVVPSIPSMEQFSTATTIDFPKQEVKVGSSWTSDNEQQGMKVKSTYTVTKIADGIVYLDVKGEVSGTGTGSMTGSSEIEISTGVLKNNESEIKVTTQGIEVSVVSNVSMNKK